MKTQLEIEFKIMVHESEIENLIKDTSDWNDITVLNIESYLKGRQALRWVLSPDDFITDDEFDKKIKYEITCYESTKYF